MKVQISALIIMFLVSCGSSQNIESNTIMRTVTPQDSNVQVDSFKTFSVGFVRLTDKENHVVCYVYTDDTTSMQCFRINE